ncbi:cupin domain-containing protein [Microbacterium sp. Root180]|uniref:cupin domain-containing protein n=1 Tax=Microbacterium sp. Root180 TaxID=1736483 RepID=UPI000700F183|nr:cupin domain-containing protein [Microbacterium sp. Root180]KRB36645.1 hypothetical protein ASD93_11370 [Microbacterium sp. Root180]
MKRVSISELLADPTPVPEPAQFSGDAFQSSIGQTQTSKATAALIRLAPAVRGNWHSHTDGQLIHVVHGSGVVGRRGQDPLRLEAGDVVWIEPGEEHYHGAAEDSALAQLALSFGPITWLGPDADAAGAPFTPESA